MASMVGMSTYEGLTTSEVMSTDKSSMKISVDGIQHIGVKELARMFSTRSKLQRSPVKHKLPSLSSPSTQPKKNGGQPTETTSNETQGLQDASEKEADQRYQNVFDDPRFIGKTKPNAVSPMVKGKKPVPTPRKPYLPAGLVNATEETSDDDDDDYEPMSSSIPADLQDLNCEIDLLQNVTDLPPLSDLKYLDKLQKNAQRKMPACSKSSGAGMLAFVSPNERKRVLDANDDGEYLTVGFSIGDSSKDDNDDEYYLPVLPDKTFPVSSVSKGKNKALNNQQNVVHRKITTEANGPQKLLKWKRSQGSIFAEEMINLMSSGDESPQFPPSNDDEVGRSSLHSYMEIDGKDRPMRVISTASSEPVYIGLEEGPADYISPVQSPSKSYECTTRDATKCLISPPDLFPKSESLLREQEICYMKSDEKFSQEYMEDSLTESTVRNPEATFTNPSKQGTKTKKIIRALKQQTFGMNKKKKNFSPVISSPKLPLIPPRKKPTEDITGQLSSLLDSDQTDCLNSPSNLDQSLCSHTSVSASPTPITVTAIVEETTLNHADMSPTQPVTFINTATRPLYRACSDAGFETKGSLGDSFSRTSSLCSKPESNNDMSGDDDDEEPVLRSLVTTTRHNRLNSTGSKNRVLEDSLTLNSFSIQPVVGYFTCQGGTLSSRESGVRVTIPVDAVPKGKRQKLWFNVLQTVYREDRDSLSDNVPLNPSGEVESSAHLKKESAVQLSLTVLIGPPDAVLNKPMKVFIPHCAPVDSGTWNLKIIGRASQSDDWEQLTPSSNNFIPSLPKQKKYKNSTYRIYSDYFRVKTRQVGSFRMTGKPIGQNTSKVIKKMVCSVYCQEKADEVHDTGARIKVFVTNAFLDSVEALHHVQMSEGYVCLERNVPVICYGNHCDLKVSIQVEKREGKVTTCTQMIPFETFWRVTRIGQAMATFDLSNDEVKNSEVIQIELSQKKESHHVFEVLLSY